MPDPANLPKGCKFHERCPKAIKPCTEIEPESVEIEPGHFVKCLLCGSQIPNLGGRVPREAAGEHSVAGKREKEQSRAEGRKLGEKKPDRKTLKKIKGEHAKDKGGAKK
jgi:hypothetical protein